MRHPGEYLNSKESKVPSNVFGGFGSMANSSHASKPFPLEAGRRESKTPSYTLGCKHAKICEDRACHFATCCEDALLFPLFRLTTFEGLHLFLYVFPEK